MKAQFLKAQFLKECQAFKFEGEALVIISAKEVVKVVSHQISSSTGDESSIPLSCEESFLMTHEMQDFL